VVASLDTLGLDGCGWNRDKPGHSGQIIGGHGEPVEPVHTIQAAQFDLTEYSMVVSNILCKRRFVVLALGHSAAAVEAVRMWEAFFALHICIA
jgi:hypothetical protein